MCSSISTKQWRNWTRTLPVRILSLVVRAAPTWLPGLINYGNALASSGNLAEAQVQLQETVTLNADSFEARGSLAMVLMEMGEKDKERKGKIDLFCLSVGLNATRLRGCWVDLLFGGFVSFRRVLSQGNR
jgi:hypothetical protein